MPRNLVEPDRAGKRGVGYQGVMAQRSAWPGPAPTQGPGGGDAALELGKWTTAVTPGSFCKHSQERRGPGRSKCKAFPALVPEMSKKRPPPGSGRESSTPSDPSTSLRPGTAPGRSCSRSSQGWPHNSAAKCPSCPVIFPRTPVGPPKH